MEFMELASEQLIPKPDIYYTYQSVMEGRSRRYPPLHGMDIRMNFRSVSSECMNFIHEIRVVPRR